MPPEWWESFFRGGWASVHSDVNDPERSAAEAELIEEYLALTPGAAVLDVPCGDGRLSIPAKPGFMLRLRTTTFFAWSTSRIGIP